MLSVLAIKTPSQLTSGGCRGWENCDGEVVSQVTVLGLVVKTDLKTESLANENLSRLTPPRCRPFAGGLARKEPHPGAAHRGGLLRAAKAMS